MMLNYFYHLRQIKRLGLICSLPLLLTGCAEFIATQEPAPVYGNNSHVNSKPSTVVANPTVSTPAPAPASKTSEIVKTEPLASMDSKIIPIEIKAPPITPKEEQEQEPVAAKNKPETAVEQDITPVEPSSPAPSFQPLETFAAMSPGVGSLVVAANKSTQSGNVDSATTTIERAIRIEPRNAALYYQLALLKLKQNKPKQAEDLARKSALLAGKDASLKKHSWLLVSEAKEKQNDSAGATQAREKANKF